MVKEAFNALKMTALGACIADWNRHDRLRMSATRQDIVIIGAGLSGLACARKLARAGLDFTVYEASDDVGGRVRTDVVDGFRLDRGFQIFLPAYPEAERVLDLDDLDLHRMRRGANIFWKDRLHRIADPLFHPIAATAAMLDPVVPWRDKWFTLLLRKELRELKEVPRQLQEMTTEQYLRDFGFSEDYIDRFMRPFFGGVFLEKDLRTSARMFAFLFAMFDRGGAALPADGMAAIPKQLASALSPGAIKLNAPALSVRPGEVTLHDGTIIRASHIIVATHEEMAVRLLSNSTPVKLPHSRSTTCFYFATGGPLCGGPVLYLDGDGRGPVNNACILSKVAPSYAPEGQHLISASIIGAPSSEELEGVVRDQLANWFGTSSRDWRLLKTYQIRNAQPECRQLRLGDAPADPLVSPGLYRCGDYCEDVSINGALLSGRRAAEAVIEAVTRCA